MAHTGLLMPHAEARYDDGELKWPNEIDLPLITLGATVDGAFKQALADAIDPFGNLDKNEGVVSRTRCVTRTCPTTPCSSTTRTARNPDDWEFHRPWAYPQYSEFESGGGNTEVPTPTETYDPSKSGNDPNDIVGPAVAYKPMRPGPYPEGTTPDQVFFRTDAPVDRDGRAAVRIRADALADRPAQRAVHREGTTPAQPARRPGAVLRLSHRPDRESHRVRDAVQPGRRPRLRLPDLGLEPRRRDRRDRHATSSTSCRWRRPGSTATAGSEVRSPCSCTTSIRRRRRSSSCRRRTKPATEGANGQHADDAELGGES